MTYQQLENKWIGKRVDYDGVYQYQCVDLTKQYLAEVYGMKPGAVGLAGTILAVIANIINIFGR